jgi:hypothetical protein
MGRFGKLPIEPALLRRAANWAQLVKELIEQTAPLFIPARCAKVIRFAQRAQVDVRRPGD